MCDFFSIVSNLATPILQLARAQDEMSRARAALLLRRQQQLQNGGAQPLQPDDETEPADGAAGEGYACLNVEMLSSLDRLVLGMGNGKIVHALGSSKACPFPHDFLKIDMKNPAFEKPEYFF